MLLTLGIWLVALEAMALAVTPVAWRAFYRMPDSWWAFSKPLGLVLVGLAAWGIGLTHTLPNSRWSVLAALALVALVSWLPVRRQVPTLWAELRERSGAVLTTELVLLSVFVGVALLRAAVPGIGHTEQTSDLMFLSSVTTSPFYPPTDAWMAGEPVSYYYLGYLFIGALTLLTGVGVGVGYTLGLATVAALGAVSAFGLASALVRLARGSQDGAALAGVCAVFGLLIASNLEGVLELVRAGGGGTEGFWSWVGVNGLTAGAPAPGWHPDGFWWWFKASRVVPGAISEFPAFSLVLGDLHPHVLSLGFLLLTAAASVQLVLQPGLLRWGALRQHWPLVLVVVAATGALGAINLWDLPLGLALVVGAILLNAVRSGRTDRLGAAVALRAEHLAVGAPGSPVEDVPYAGEVRLFHHRDGAWRTGPRLHHPVPEAGARFGSAIAMDEHTLLVGAPGASETGLALVYGSDDAGAWTLRASRPPNARGPRVWRAGAGGGTTQARGAQGAGYRFESAGPRWDLVLEARPAGAGESFGRNVVLNETELLAGAPADGMGAVHRWMRWSDGWRAAEPLRIPNDAGISGLGRSLAADGRVLTVGGAGGVQLFNWQDEAWVAMEQLRPSGAGARGSFGTSLGVSGLYLAVGAPQEHAGAAGAGAAYVYHLSEDGWVKHARVIAADGGAQADFGAALALSGDLLAVGAAGSGQGAAYTYRRSLDRWRPMRKLVGRWSLARALTASGLLTGAALALIWPFLSHFDAVAQGVLPLRDLLTRPLHLALLWGVQAVLLVPLLVLAARRSATRAGFHLGRLLLAAGLTFAPIVLWLQPIYGVPIYALLLLLLVLHRAGVRLTSLDESSFSLNTGVTRFAGGTLLAGLLLYNGITYAESGPDGAPLPSLAIARLLTVIPLAAAATLAFYVAWTLAYRDAERLRGGREPQEGALTTVLGLVGMALMLVMGVELWRVVDVFDGELRRWNTFFKLTYQAWQLTAVAGAFGIWYVGSQWRRAGVASRVGRGVWTGALVAGAVLLAYYPAAAITSRVAEAGGRFSLDGLSDLARSAPGELAVIDWIRTNTPRDALVLEAPEVSSSDAHCGQSAYTSAGRIAAATGRPTLVAWTGSQRQWRSDGAAIDRRCADARAIYRASSADEAAPLLDRYGVDYVVVGTREQGAYGPDAGAGVAALGTVAFVSNGFIVYLVNP
ncbi:MAG: DUF2298 domain-containing protein [Chloroflexota bacterium]